ncbi:uncharacterized protein LOC125643196 [Caretta caretta]|uniref:uncharacterized protein LOC125643196 n=1 Tax=Caretta caretta TaxID=8467 RepID=UPI003F4BE3BC
MQSPPSQETTQSRIRRQAPAWSEQEVRDLISCWEDESVMEELCSKKRNANTYIKVSRANVERGYSTDTELCCRKIKELRQAYQKAREENGRSGSQLHTCRFYRELHAVMGDDATTTPPLSMDTCKGGVARSEEDEFLEDEEEEDEDSAQAASGESIFPPSQELFLTLEPIVSPHSQGMLPDHDPGEGTSAGVNVSAWPLSTPSQRLAQIRRQKKRTWDDMFAELMQSSRTDRAQLNAWRQTIAESRKALHEYEERRDVHAESRQDAMVKLMAEQTDMLSCMVDLMRERQQDHRLPLQPLYNHPPSSPSFIASSPRRPRTQGAGGYADSHSQPQRIAQAAESWHILNFDLVSGLVLPSSSTPLTQYPPSPV